MAGTDGRFAYRTIAFAVLAAAIVANRLRRRRPARLRLPPSGDQDHPPRPATPASGDAMLHPPASKYALAVLAAAIVASVILIAAWGTAFVSGDPLGYAYRLATQPLGDAMLHPPANKYLIAVPLLLYKGLFETFGLDSYAPYRVVGIALVVVCAVLLFVLLRRRVGDLLAVPPAVLMLFFGPGSSVVLTPDRVPSQIALAAGLGMMIALERQDLRGDVAAAVLLGVALASHPVGIAFAAVGVVMVLMRPPPERFTRLWVVAAPGAMFAAWWLFIRTPNTGSDTPGPGDIIGFATDSWVSLVAGVTGLFGILDGPSFEETLGWVAAGLLLVLVVVAVVRHRSRLPVIFWAASAGLLILIAATRLSPEGSTRVPDEPRYLYPEAFLLLIALAGVAAAVRPPKWVLWGVSGLLLLSLWPSIARLDSEGQTLRIASDRARAQLGAIEIAGENALPDFEPTRYMPTVAEYTAAADAYGGIGFTPEEIAAQSPPIRLEADRALVGALGLELGFAASRPDEAPVPQLVLGAAGGADREGCLEVSSKHAEVALRSEGVWVRAEHPQEASFNLGRFADQAFVPVTSPADAREAALFIAPDDADVPWRLGIDSREPVTICGAGTDAVSAPSPDAAAVNLTPDDFPSEYATSSTAGIAAFTAAVLRCLGAPVVASSRSITAAVGPAGAMSSEVTVSQAAASAEAAFEALTAPRATGCVEEALARGRGAIVNASKTGRTFGFAEPAQTFEYTLISTGQPASRSIGDLVLFARGPSLIVISAVGSGDEPFPRGLLSDLARTVEGRAAG